MKIFLSWAGSVSQAVAVTLRKHLPLMVQSLDVFMSKHDIGSGARWGQELSSQVDTTSFGVFCLTPGSISSPWVQFGLWIDAYSKGEVVGVPWTGDRVL
jgi:hypothetical protein